MRALLTICFALILAAPASADVFENAIIMGESYVAGPPAWDPWLNEPNIGDPLWMVGPVVQLWAPFDDRTLPPPGTYEVTYAYTGFQCARNGNWDDFENNIGGSYSDFEGGVYSVYLDTSPDANFSNVATFQDGELILQASVDVLSFISGHPDYGFWSGMRFTGGSWFDEVSNGGVGYYANVSGLFTGDILPIYEGMGYVGQSLFSGVTILVPVATEVTTWGKVKALYR